MGYISKNRKLTNTDVQTIMSGLESGESVENHIHDFRTHMEIPPNHQIEVQFNDGYYSRHLMFIIDGKKFNYNPRRGVLLLSLSEN